ncbi:E3 ubiquitin-protein ligase EL5-like [Triticum aestivum]|nr:E3 ubiquitin-protein ligase EL5-like [Triticum aestivum]
MLIFLSSICLVDLVEESDFSYCVSPDMLPGPPPPLLMGYPSVPSASPSAAPSSSIGASIAIIAIVIIASTLVILCIKVFCRSPRPPRPSWSPFSRRSSISRRASSLGESDKKHAAEAAVHASLGASASSRKHAEGLVFGLKVPVPSAPSLPEVEQVILGLLSQPRVLLQQGMFCCICAQNFVPSDMILSLPACLHKFHERCIIPWIRGHAPYCCPFCDASITMPCPDPDKTHSSDRYDVEAQTMVAPAPPGEEVAEAVGGSRGWLRSSLDRLSGSWRGCSSSHATAVVVPVSSRRTTGSWRVNNSDKEDVEAVGGSHGWLGSFLATLSSTWSGHSDSRSTTMVSSVSSGCATGSLSLVLSGCGSADLCSRSWDPEAAVQKT